MYPNPANDKIALQLNNSEQNDLTILDLLGKEVMHKSYSNGINDFISLTNLEAGTYFVNVKNKNGNMTKKLIIE
jgi:hypothetical protein